MQFTAALLATTALISGAVVSAAEPTFTTVPRAAAVPTTDAAGRRQAAMATFFAYPEDTTCDYSSDGDLYNVVAAETGTCQEYTRPAAGVSLKVAEPGCTLISYEGAGCQGAGHKAVTNICMTDGKDKVSFKVVCS